MAERRMFAKSIVLSDAFLDMPMSARCLYFTLGMLADDDGFIGSPKAIMRQCGASQDDMLMLLQKRYVLTFESGVIVIKHWRMNNYLQNDRKKDTTYLEEKNTLILDAKGAYTEKNKALEKASETSDEGMYTECIQSVYTGKDSIDKYSIDKDKDIGAEAPSIHKQKPKKHKHGEYQNVLLTDEELQKLQIEYDEVAVKKAIKKLDEYIEEKGYKSKSHYLAMKRWVMSAVNKDQQTGKDSKSDGQLDNLVEHLMEQM